jgi:hypothetical protein
MEVWDLAAVGGAAKRAEEDDDAVNPNSEVEG